MPNSSEKINVKTRKRPFSLSDTLYLLCLIGVGTASAGLPFYVHFHPGKFGPPTMEFSGNPDRGLAESIGYEDYGRRVSALLKPQLLFDQVTTGSIPDIKGPRAETSIQPFPEAKDSDSHTLTLLYVGQNQALVDDNGKVALVRVGGKLSRDISVLSITKRGGVWEVKISDGGVFFWSPVLE